MLSDAARAQSSQASLQGQVINQASGEPIATALVIQRNLLTNTQGYRYTNDQGYFSFPVLQPGTYTVRTDALGFQPEERSPVELPVAARLELNFAMIRNVGAIAASPATPPAPRLGENPRNILAILYGAAAVPQAGLVRLPVSQTETLIGSISSLIDEIMIQELPLAGRDVYTLLVLQPNVGSDHATARGLGFSVNGQHSSSSNYLLDGVDNNDLQVPGPATKISADAVKEYRMNTNNFTAEYGRNAGFLGNAITRSGTNRIQGTLFEFTGHDQLNANSFANNWKNLSKEPFQQNQFGGTLGGPVLRDRLFYFGSLEQLRSFTESQPLPYLLPSASLVALAPANSIAKKLLTEFPPPEGNPIPGFIYANVKEVRLPFPQVQSFALGRGDYVSADGQHRLSARYSFSQDTQDDFVFSLYPGFNSPLVVRGHNLSLNYTRDLGSGTNELKFGFNRNRVQLIRRHPEIPVLKSNDLTLLPGSDAGQDYDFRETVFHVTDNYSRLSGRHAVVMGFEWRPYLHDSLLSAGRDGAYSFSNVLDFASDLPFLLQLTMNRRTNRPLEDADFRRYYYQSELAGFFQDNWKFTRRLALNLGVRYEYFGAPSPRRGKEDFNFVFGSGANIHERIAGGSIRPGSLYLPDRNNFAPRFGFALNLTGSGRSVLRGGYGIYFDRIFNNFWMDARANPLTLQTYINSPFSPIPQPFNYTIPARNGVSGILGPGRSVDVAVDQHLRTPYVQSWFVGWQHQMTSNLILEVNHSGSLGRKLAAADIINRTFTTPSATNPNGRINLAEPNISYRGNQGVSNYLAIQVELNRRWERGMQFQVSYTLGRSRDVQSDPLRRPVNTQSSRTRRVSAISLFTPGSSFTRQFDPRSDYGNSDFDQRQNLVFNFVAQIPQGMGMPRFFYGWEASGVAGFRSGLPFSVFSRTPSNADQTAGTNLEYVEPGNGLIIANGADSSQNRADFFGSDPSQAFLASPPAIKGGLILLDKSRFGHPVSSRIGTSRRNGFFGPGFWNFDLSLSKRFLLPMLGERVSLQFRAELFNVLNHTNLDNPIEPILGAGDFGEASFGRQGAGASGIGSSSPASSPLNEQPRRIQVALKLYF